MVGSSSPMSSPSLPDTAVMDAAFGADTFDAFELDVPDAQVRLRPHAQADRVHVRGFVPDADPETARTVFDRKGISTHQSGDQLHVYGDSLSTTVEDWRWRDSHPTAVHLDVFLPPDLDVTARTPGGAINASGLTGALDLNVMGGSVTAERLEGSIRIQGSGGTLSVQDSLGLSLDLEWSAGPVRLQNIEGETTTLRARAASTTLHDIHGPVDLSVHGAPLELRDVDGPCEARVQGSTLTYNGAPTHETSLTVVGGHLSTNLPPTHDAELMVTGSTVALDDAFAFNGEQTSKHIEGTLNGGGPRLRLRAVRGTATCTPK